MIKGSSYKKRLLRINYFINLNLSRNDPLLSRISSSLWSRCRVKGRQCMCRHTTHGYLIPFSVMEAGPLYRCHQHSSEAGLKEAKQTINHKTRRLLLCGSMRPNITGRTLGKNLTSPPDSFRTRAAPTPGRRSDISSTDL